MGEEWREGASDCRTAGSYPCRGSDVVLAATRAYPFQEIGRLAFNFGRQLALFRPGVGLDARIVVDQDGNPASEPASYNRTWVGAVGILSIAGMIASLALLFVRWRSMPQLRPLIILVVLGILRTPASASISRASPTAIRRGLSG